MQFTRVLALYDPFGVDVPLKFDITLTHSTCIIGNSVLLRSIQSLPPLTDMSLRLGGRLLLLLLGVPGVWSRGHWGVYRVYSKPKPGNRASGSHPDSANQCWRELQSPRPCRVITATGKTVDIPDKDKDVCEDCSWGPRTCNGKGGAFNVYFCNTYEPLVSVYILG